jgi:hypothetical protein
MKNNSSSSLFFFASLVGLAWSIAATPPSGAPWAIFAADPATLYQKFSVLGGLYLWPAVVACFGIILVQLQFRLSSSGANRRTVFAACIFASGAMLMGLRTVAMSPPSGPAYVAGMALGYTLMARLYAVRLRKVGPLQIPWPVWRGNAGAVRDIDQAVQAHRQSSGR